MIKLVLSDIDNTLIPFGAKHASERTLRAIRTCLDAGVAFGPATGRNRPEVGAFLRHHEECYATSILVNGQQVYLKGQLMREVTIDADDLMRAQEIVLGHRHCALITYREDGHADWVGDDYSTLGPFPARAMFNGSTRHQSLPTTHVVKSGIIAYVERDEELALQEELIQACPHLDFANTVAQWFDVVPRGCTKADGVDLLIDALGIRTDEVCAFGDATNDLAMLSRVGHPCAVANALPEVLDAARWHVGASDEDGVAAALERIARGLMPAEREA